MKWTKAFRKNAGKEMTVVRFAKFLWETAIIYHVHPPNFSSKLFCHRRIQLLNLRRDETDQSDTIVRQWSRLYER